MGLGCCRGTLRFLRGIPGAPAAHDSSSSGDEDLAVRAEQIAARTFELSQLLIDVLGITNAAEQLGSYFPEHVTYHSSCHGMRLLHLGSRQSDLVRTVEGIKYNRN